MARETLVLVPLGLVFFVPLALAERLHWGFWPAFALGVILAAFMIAVWFRFDPMAG
jgi:inner membrane protein involved in colicin E2 resistance